MKLLGNSSKIKRLKYYDKYQMILFILVKRKWFSCETLILPVSEESITRYIKVLFSFHLRSDLPSILEAASCQEMFPVSKKHKHMNKETYDEETDEYTLTPGGVLNIKRKMGHLPQISKSQI